MVTSAGAILQMDADRDPERFHAMRTGRTAFGLVTAMTIALQPAEGHYAGGLWFSASDAGPVPHRWRTWIADLPPTASTSIAQLRILTRRSSPEQVRGQAVLHVRLAFLGDPADGVVSTTGAGLLGVGRPGCSLRCALSRRCCSMPCVKSPGEQWIGVR